MKLNAVASAFQKRHALRHAGGGVARQPAWRPKTCRPVIDPAGRRRFIARCDASPDCQNAPDPKNAG